MAVPCVRAIGVGGVMDLTGGIERIITDPGVFDIGDGTFPVVERAPGAR